MALNFSTSPEEYKFTVDKFGGVDFSTQANKVDMSRSPNAQNIIMNENGYLEKRTGYKNVFADSESDKINGIFTYHYADKDGETHTRHYAHIGTKLCEVEFTDGNITLASTLLTNLADKKSRGFEFSNALYIVGCGYYMVKYDGYFDCIAYGKISNAFKGETASNMTKISNTKYSDYCFENNEHIIYDVKNQTLYTNTYQWGATKINLGKANMFDHTTILGVYKNGSEIVSQNGGIGWVVTEENGYIIISLKTYSGTDNNSVTGDITIRAKFNNVLETPTTFVDRSVITTSQAGDTDDTTKYDGTVYYSENIASGIREIEFKSSTSTLGKSYYLQKGGIFTIIAVYLNGKIIRRLKFDEDKGFKTATGYAWCDGYNFGTGVITIEYTINYNEYPLDRCDVYGIYGGNNDTRVFIAGDSKYGSRDYCSYINSGNYFPDDRYTDVGTDNSEIMGYHKMYSNQIIIKDGLGSDASQYLRSSSISQYSDGEQVTVYSHKQGMFASPALCKSSFKTLLGTPLYISQDGVFGIIGTQVESESNTLQKSSLINKKLLSESGLNGAVCAVYKGRYYIYINNAMYVLDGKTSEWFYYTDLPDISCIWIYDDVFYFGTDDGRICRFMQADENNAYYDNIALDGSITNASAINAVWEFPQTALDEYTMYKTIRNVYLTCMPYHRSSITVYYNTNDDYEDETMKENIDLFDFGDIDFERFTFNNILAPQIFATGVKCKNIFVFGLKLQNDIAGEPFGLLAVSIKYRKSKYIK